MNVTLPFLLFLLVTPAFAQPKPDLTTPYERSGGLQTATYPEIIDYYRRLDRQFEQAKLIEVGQTDVGKPLHLFLLAADQSFTARPNRVTLLINNGIHPGEPEGIDACMMLARDLLQANKLPKNVLLAIVPVFNVDGCLNRGVSRVNQNGPETYGFRGNARNLNLNRDFIKADAENTKAFQTMFQQLKPQVFIDNHTSDGADYQHVVTYFATQKDKLHPALSGYMTQTFQPALDKALAAGGFPTAPYVNNPKDKPESGLLGYNDSPRYSTGYAALFNCFGFTLETHMWKDYPARVKGSYAFDEAVLRLCERDAPTILANKQRADAAVTGQTTFALNYRLDRSRVDSVTFLGYEAAYKPSEVSGLQRLYYDRARPFTKRIPYLNHFVPDLQLTAPRGYVIPQGWREVIALLKRNGVRMQAFARDTLLPVSAYYLDEYKTAPRPYEGHYLHTGVKVRTETQRLPFYKGDYLILTNQPANRYLIETLEPQAQDSFFAWNFFDSILDQKEYFSDYIFEDTAAELLRNDPALRQKLADKRASDKVFAESANAQLEFIYKQTPYFEKTYNRYPVYRLEGGR
ncbi:peptidase M14, carboxypeptidase A [Fibrella aestuarina BUZ 2]|uniref:Peptidase M14, carboxypeptidase A n=1 Tax=Fibrella aestuarina BUZ 2 TaxID=1166018 RepID=I0K244_9BACT|nr:M14 family metallopeptidase [Fibrella aestuarina]CCG98197.1 peptidase M14, carboxypeptidase A [Fibrella aestuarina BUZ 2]